MNDKTKFFLVAFGVIAGLAMISGGGVIVYEKYKSLGIRHHNPGNIRPSRDAWQGQAGTYRNLNGEYLKFKAPEWGIRAIYKNLLTYRNKYGLDTIAKIITRWAPPGDKNDTPAYIAFVSKQTGRPSTAVLALSDYLGVIKAIIQMENGVQPYPDDLIKKGIALATA